MSKFAYSSLVPSDYNRPAIDTILRDIEKRFNGVVQLPVYTNAARPPATDYAAGSAIWNSDDNFTNVSDGTDWRDPTGSVT